MRHQRIGGFVYGDGKSATALRGESSGAQIRYQGRQMRSGWQSFVIFVCGFLLLVLITGAIEAAAFPMRVEPYESSASGINGH